ncbi:hypothetical protein FOL47_001559 [Perkinsus chesapeaki]|uniref:Uncharacterized protein n=1 Tax=Perkinsus chesapeaki TaxID=330153 RepID=A0A7J6MIU4_PERCH|nr:hypothetical protein FOL47_001559 [Perkinsus chesapeaki]
MSMSVHGLSKTSTIFHKVIRPGVCVELTIVHKDGVYIKATVKCQAVSSAYLAVNQDSSIYTLQEGSRQAYEKLMKNVFYRCENTARMVDNDLVPFQYDGRTQTVRTTFEGEDLSFETGECQPGDYYASGITKIDRA